ncbi:hypothetical protein HMPREF9517_02244 [Enterococcus faecalis TX1341]|nr:hypothetical protein HMPREF9517_02244 [Enterococcus faecalis TX1341]
MVYSGRSCFCSRRFQFLSVEQKSKVIFVPRSLFFCPNTTDIILGFIL